jgi:CubicO group peptidase (beta-lactamase class C family)
MAPERGQAVNIADHAVRPLGIGLRALPPVGGSRPGDPRPRSAGVSPLGGDALPLLRARFASLARRYGVPGAQLAIHRRGETVAVEVGELEHRGGRRVSPASVFPVGSITKSFTATLAMVLVADGDLDLDAPLLDELPELGELGDELTLRQLLSHTGGLAAGPDSDDVGSLSGRRYLTGHCQRRDLVLPPGNGFSYSNAGYVVIGTLVEAVTGMPWAQALATIVLDPLGIDSTFVDDLAPPRPWATGHAVSAGRTRPVRQSLAAVEAPAGALAASATSLVRLGAALIEGGGPLTPGAAAMMRRPEPGAVPFGLADGWGLGVATYEEGWIGHDGNGLGTACYWRADPADGWVVGFTSNASTGRGMWLDLCEHLRHLGVPVGDAVSSVAELPVLPAPRGCFGTYANGDVTFGIVDRGGRAFFAVDDDAPAPMTFHDGLIFSVRDPDTGRPVPGGRLVRDTHTGQVNAIQIGGRLARRTRATTDARTSRIA